MDAIFGPHLYRNEIVWKRTSAHNNSRSFGRIYDRILFYGQSINMDAVRRPLDDEYIATTYNLKDERGGVYMSDNLTGPAQEGDTRPWRNWKPGAKSGKRGWSVPKTGAYAAWIEQKFIPGYRAENDALARLDMLDKAGFVFLSKNGTPRLKRYLAANPGQVPGNIWTEIPPVSSQSNENTGYPTQKPIALLNRIIKASSNPGDFVFDPFCGCATTLVAADRLQRQWVGIDLSPLAVKLVVKRLKDDQRPLFADVNALKDPPVRTDLGKLPNYRNHKHTLFGRQEGRCNGCEMIFPFRNMTVDHIVPQLKGGMDNIENLQLLCSACNSVKGTGTQAELKARLKRDGIL